MPWAWTLLPPQDSQCGTVIDVNIDCAVKLIGTNCIIYPVNSKDLQHIWVSRVPTQLPGSHGGAQGSQQLALPSRPVAVTAAPARAPRPLS